MSPFPAQNGSGLGLVKVGMGKSGQGPFGGDMVVQDQEFFRFCGHRLQNWPCITEVDDQYPTVIEIGRRRLAVFDGEKSGVRKFLPDRPGGSKPVKAVRMVQDDVRGTVEW